MNEIKLEFKKSLTKLAGYSYGKNIYDEQVKNKIDINREIVIIFPDNIKDIASSFIQGFFYDFVENIGIKGIERQVDIVSSDPEMKQKIIKNLI
jgi:hypothetical protein